MLVFMSEQEKEGMPGFSFDRMELAGSLGDLGTLIPIAAGMILLNGLSPTSVLLWVGAFYIFSGLYFRLPIPVQPLKVVGAIAIASPERITEPVIAAAGMVFGVVLLFLSVSRAMDFMSRLFTRPVIRGIQLGLGLVLMRKGFELFVSQDLFVTGAGPACLGGLPLNLMIGASVFIMVLVLLNNRKAPAAIAALVAGLVAGSLLGGLSGMELSFGPERMSLTVPDAGQFWAAFILLVIPQIPLTIGNAAMGTADTACSLFPGSPALSRATPGRFALTMGLINIPAGLFAGMPMCHGAGGLAAHYRFGARTGGSNLMIGALFLVLALVLGKASMHILTLIPSSVLGVLLVFAGIELCLLIRDLDKRSALFVAALVAGIAVFNTNMAWAFAAGIACDFIIRRLKVEI